MDEESIISHFLSTKIHSIGISDTNLIGYDSSGLAKLTWFAAREQGADISAAGDLGFVFGTAEGKITQPDGNEVEGIGGYVRVWNKEDPANKPPGEARMPKSTTISISTGHEGYIITAEVMSLRPKQ